MLMLSNADTPPAKCSHGVLNSKTCKQC